MSLDASIVSKLTGTAGILAVVAARVKPHIIPKGYVLPAITYQRVSTVTFRSHDGPTGLVRARYTITSWASTLAAARALADLVRIAIDCQGWTAASETVQVCFIDGESALSDFDTDPETPRFGIEQDYLLLHNEATA